MDFAEYIALSFPCQSLYLFFPINSTIALPVRYFPHLTFKDVEALRHYVPFKIIVCCVSQYAVCQN